MCMTITTRLVICPQCYAFTVVHQNMIEKEAVYFGRDVTFSALRIINPRRVCDILDHHVCAYCVYINLFVGSGTCRENRGIAAGDVDAAAAAAADFDDADADDGGDGGWCAVQVWRAKTTSRSVERRRRNRSVCHCRTARPPSLSVR